MMMHYTYARLTYDDALHTHTHMMMHYTYARLTCPSYVSTHTAANMYIDTHTNTYTPANMTGDRDMASASTARKSNSRVRTFG